MALSKVLSWFRDAPWLNPKRLAIYPKLLLAVYIAVYAVWAFGSASVGRSEKPIGVDFTCFWAASELALAGQPFAAYDIPRLHAVEKEVAGKDTFIAPWLYPPMFLVVVLPLALAPYFASLVAWIAVMLSAFFLVIYGIAPHKYALWLTAAFPGTVANVVNGQNGLLTCALFGGALLMLEERPVLAGVLFGLMTYKPQIGVLVPLVLMATGRWRAFAAAVVTALAFAGISYVLFGGETWQAFSHNLDFIKRTVIEGGGVKYSTMQSTFAAARLLGGGIAMAYAAQAAVFLIAAVTTVMIWRSDAPFAVKASALVVASVLSTIYIVYYDLVLLGLPIAWLAIQGEREGFLPYEKSLLVAAWILPLFCEFVAEHLTIPLNPVICLLLMALLVYRARRSIRREVAVTVT